MRVNTLCFKCGEIYTPTHTCSAPVGNLHMMEQTSVDGGEVLYEGVLEALENPQCFQMSEDHFLSLHAISGIPQHKTIQLRALAANQALIILVDFGRSHL
jgi:hypothetical protein